MSFVGQVTIVVDPASGGIGGDPKSRITLNGTDPYIEITDSDGKNVITLRAGVEGWGEAKGGIMLVQDSAGKDSIVLNGGNNSIHLRDSAGSDSITLNGASGNVDIYNKDRRRALALRPKEPDDKTAGLWLGAATTDPGTGPLAGFIAMRNSAGIDSIVLDGRSGDIILNNADCAEDFDIAKSAEIESGTVMVIEQEGKLKECDLPYDKRVAGVISGGGNYKPGLVLDKRKSLENRKSISLMGKVHCKVDAQSAAIDVGDLLTTSSTKGHAMKAADPMKAFGAVIGKALSPLNEGRGLIPILIALQ